jgi:G3E family GTPase
MVRSDLIDTLLELHRRWGLKSSPGFDRIVVETTGLADPAPIFHTLMSDPDLTRRFYMDGIVTTVDALEGERQLLEYPESAKQVASADSLVLTKLDLAGSTQTSSLRDQVRALNPRAQLHESGTSGPGAAELFHVGPWDTRARQLNADRWLGERSVSGTSRASHLHSSGIHSFCVTREGPLSRAALGLWLSQLTMDAGDKLLRLKGIINVQDAPGPVIVHGVHHRLYPPATLRSWPDRDERTRVVFIVRDLEKGEVEARLDRAMGQVARVADGG